MTPGNLLGWPRRPLFDEADAMLCPSCGGAGSLPLARMIAFGSKILTGRECPECGGVGYVPKAGQDFGGEA